MRRSGLVLLIALAAAAGTTAGPALAVGEVEDGHTLVVIGQSGVERADELGRATGTEPAGAMWYLGLHEGDAVEPVLADIAAAVESHPGLVVNLGVSFGALSTPSPPHTALIAAGAYDATIARLAEWLEGLPTIAYLRLGYEFDLLGGQYGPPELYKAAYRHVVDELRSHGVSNAVYVWHSAGAFWRAADPSLFAVGSGTVAKAARDLLQPPLPDDALPIAAFHPGRGYVDAFGISYWQDGCCFGRSSQQARDIYEARTRELLVQARNLGLPLQISEATPVYVGADSGAESVDWLDRTFALVEDFDIEMLSLISIDWRAGGFFAAPFWNGYWPDARIHRYPDTCARYVERTSAGDRYIQRTEDLPQRLGLGGEPGDLPSPAQQPPGGCGP
jgi:hypothetical protein